MDVAYLGAVAPFEVSPLTPGFGASIGGADLSSPLHLDALKTVFRDHRLVAIRGQALSNEKLYAFASIFGAIEVHYNEIFLVGNAEDSKAYKHYNFFRKKLKGTVPEKELDCYVWHSLRHGGCTDLLDSGVPLDVVMMHGRWKSSAWLSYRHWTDRTRRFLEAARTPALVPDAVAAAAAVLPLPPDPPPPPAAAGARAGTRAYSRSHS